MYCPKCGKENNDENLFCSHCASSLKPSVKTEEENIKNLKKGMFTALLLNITSLLFIAFSILSLYLMAVPETQTYYLTQLDKTLPLCYIGVVIAIFGIVIYFVKQQILAYIHLVASIIMMFVYLAVAIALFTFTCGLGFLFPIFNSLQIISAIKNIRAIKNAE